jgi:tripeptidyl-peptidase-1
MLCSKWLVVLVGLVSVVESATLPNELTFFVKQQAHLLAELESKFHSVSDPDSADYGKHLTLEETVKYQRPSEEHLSMLAKHVASVGGNIVDQSVAGDKVVVQFPPGLSVEHVFPQHLESAVDFVGGLPRDSRDSMQPLQSPSRRPHPAKPTEETLTANPYDCLKERVTPTCLRAAYGLNDTHGTNPKNGQAVIVNQEYGPLDLKLFLAKYKLPKQQIVKNVGRNSGRGGDEATLDTQYIIATGQLVPTTWVYLDGEAANPFTNWLVWASNTSVIPYVHSLSVGTSEGEAASIITRMNQEMMALGTRGTSIVFSSGDSGYKPQQKYGSSSPYVTSVGGVFNGELGMSPLQVDTLSTGGFSSLALNPIQPWQKDAVAAYLKTRGKRPLKFDSSHRCCPDLAIYDSGYYIIQGGADTPIGGTSASAPTFSGMVSLINDALLNAGKPPLGFLNYFLYKNEAAFLDITTGGNGGFDAVKGYDPASGLGTFDTATFGKLKAAALAQWGVGV